MYKELAILLAAVTFIVGTASTFHSHLHGFHDMKPIRVYPSSFEERFYGSESWQVLPSGW